MVRIETSPAWVILGLGTLLAGCRDAPTEPAALLVAAETRPALSLQGSLPTLPDLASHYDLEDALAAALDLWWRSWTVAEPQRAALRESAHAAAAPLLAAALPRESLDSLLLVHEAWVRAVSLLKPQGLPESLVDVATGGALELASGRRALDEGHPERAVRAVLRAADSLRGESAPVVAERLVRDALKRLEARGHSVGVPPLSERRARRLAQGAQHATESGDYERAIRRAYYAIQLLDGDPVPRR